MTGKVQTRKGGLTLGMPPPPHKSTPITENLEKRDEAKAAEQKNEKKAQDGKSQEKTGTPEYSCGRPKKNC